MAADEAKSDYIEDKCSMCRGTGSLPESQPVKRGEPLVISAIKCPACGGTGRAKTKH